MKTLWQPFLLHLANATDRELVRQVQYLKIWTLSGMADCFVLFFMHIGTRRVHLAGIIIAGVQENKLPRTIAFWCPSAEEEFPGQG